MTKKNSRRSFIKRASLTSAALSTAPFLLASSSNEHLLLNRTYVHQRFSPNDQINIALIGTGIQGIYDTQSALKVDGWS